MATRQRDLFADETGRPRLVRGAAVYSGSPKLAELAARLGFDTVWVEMEHGHVDFAQAEALCQAVESGGGVATIRVPDVQRFHILRALEVGARIVVVPMINTAEQARQIVAHGKFAPLGSRGYNTRSRGLRFGLDSASSSFADANASTHLFAQIETAEAVQNVQSICAVEGLSGILIGPGDLSLSLGCAGNLADAKLIAAVSECMRHARGVGRHAGILVSPGPLLDAALAAGCDLCFCAGDVTNLLQAWRAVLEDVDRRRAASGG